MLPFALQYVDTFVFSPSLSNISPIYSYPLRHTHNRYLSKNFESLQAELTTNAETYEDCIQSYENEAAAKDKRIKDLEIELMIANEKISQLEMQIEKLSLDLEKERSVNANLTATVGELESELDKARNNAGGYDDIM